jgi:hypothetical protein
MRDEAHPDKPRSKTVAVVQSSYIPWRGYFDLMKRSDELILYDDAQYTRRDWRNRNQIKTAQGLKWLTIPVEVKGRYYQKIRDTRIADLSWASVHWKTIHHAYGRAACYNEYAGLFEQLYRDCREPYLSQVNRRFIEVINGILGIKTKISWSSEYKLEGDKSERLLGMCKQAGATRYLSGPSARSYLDEELFRKEGIELCWMEYSGYQPYVQLHPPFELHVSIVDLLLNAGKNARSFMASDANKRVPDTKNS